MKKIYLLVLALACLTLTGNAQKKVLFIGSGAAVEVAGDELMIARIEALGYTVDTMKLISEAIDDSWFPADFRTTYDGFVISSSINSNHLKNSHPDFHSIDKPIICWEQGYYAKMGMGAGTQPPVPSGSALTVGTGFENHPVVGTFSSGTAVLTGDLTKSSLIQTGLMPTAAKSLLSVGGNTAIGIVEAGDSINGNAIAAARRATYFGHSEFMTIVNEDGLALFDRTLQWMLGDLDEPNQIIENLFGEFEIYANANSVYFNNTHVVNEILVYDINGKLYKTVTVNAMSGQFNVNLPAGLYITKAISGNNSYTEKLIIR